MIFKKGDHVLLKKFSESRGDTPAVILEVFSKTSFKYATLGQEHGYLTGTWKDEGDTAPLNLNSPNSNDPMFTVLTNLAKRLLDKDTKILIKVGYLNAQLGFTEEGKEALYACMFKACQADLVKMAEEVIKESKEA